jgi:hypothetical protein
MKAACGPTVRSEQRILMEKSAFKVELVNYDELCVSIRELERTLSYSRGFLRIERCGTLYARCAVCSSRVERILSRR